MNIIERLYISVTDSFFKFVYILINKASLKKLSFSDNSSLAKNGFKKFLNDTISLDELNNILKNITEKAYLIKDQNLIGSHDISRVGNQPFSIESLASRSEIEALNKIAREVICSDNEIENYLGLEIDKLDIEITLLANTNKDKVDGKEGSQNFHRDIYHSFWRGIKIFYPFNYMHDKEYGPFTFIPSNVIERYENPSFKNYSRDDMLTNRFDKHPLITRNLDRAITLKKNQMIAIDTYNCFHSGGFITTEDNFIRIIFQVVVSPPQTPNRFSDITSKHFSRMFYFFLIRLRNIFRIKRI